MKKRMIALLMMSALVFGTGGCGGTGDAGTCIPGTGIR